MTSSLLPFVNARLKQVNARGGSERYDRPRTDGAQIWSGDQPAYIYETELTTAQAERLDQATADVMTVDTILGINWQRDQTVTFDHLELDTYGNTIGSTTTTRRVKDVNNFEVVGLTELIFWDIPS